MQIVRVLCWEKEWGQDYVLHICQNWSTFTLRAHCCWVCCIRQRRNLKRRKQAWKDVAWHSPLSCWPVGPLEQQRRSTCCCCCCCGWPLLLACFQVTFVCCEHLNISEYMWSRNVLLLDDSLVESLDSLLSCWLACWGLEKSN